MTSPFASKLVHLLKTFDADTLKSFEIWLQSPWCNTNKNLIKLVESLKKYHPNFEDAKLTKEKLFHKVLPNGKYSNRRVNNLLSEAFLSAQKFLIFHRFSQEESLQADLLTREWQGRHLKEWFFQDIEAEITRLEAVPVKAWEDHLMLLWLHRRVYHHPDQNVRIQRGLEPLMNIEKHLDLSYLLEKATIINEKIFRNRLIRGEEHDIEAALQTWRSNSEQYKDHPAIQLYRIRFDYQEANLFSKYQEVKAYFFDHLDQLNEKEKKVHLLSLVNDTSALIKKGLVDITALLPLYQLGLKTGALINQGKITLSTYSTTVVASNTKGSFDFTQQFIEQYTALLKNDIQEDSANWAWAHTAYWQRDLNTSLNILLKADFKTTFFQYTGRVLNTQVYFDLYLQDDSYRSYLFNYFDNFEKWLNREKKWADSHKSSFLHFVQKARRLARYYGELDFSAKKVKGLLEDISNIQALNWLQQKQREVLELKLQNHPREQKVR